MAAIAVQSITSNSLKALCQDVLCHSSDELEGRKGFMFDLSGFVIKIPVADGLAIIAFDPSYRDRRRYNILCQVLCQSLSARGHISILQKSDKAFGIISPCHVNVLFQWLFGEAPYTSYPSDMARGDGEQDLVTTGAAGGYLVYFPFSIENLPAGRR